MSILRYFGPRSPFGPTVAGALCVISSMLLFWIVAPIAIKATVWWWSLWLP